MRVSEDAASCLCGAPLTQRLPEALLYCPPCQLFPPPPAGLLTGSPRGSVLLSPIFSLSLCGALAHLCWARGLKLRCSVWPMWDKLQPTWTESYPTAWSPRA